jgi:hypothetical protein
MRLRFRGWDRHNTVHEHPITRVFVGWSDKNGQSNIFKEDGFPGDPLDFIFTNKDDGPYWFAQGAINSINMTGKYYIQIEIGKNEFRKYVIDWLHNSEFKHVIFALHDTFVVHRRVDFNDGQYHEITDTSEYRNLVHLLAQQINNSLRLESLIEDLSAAFGDLEKDHDDKIPGLFLKLVSSVTDALNKRKERLADQE